MPTTDLIFSVGCGSDEDNRKNALMLTTDGTLKIESDLICDKVTTNSIYSSNSAGMYLDQYFNIKCKTNTQTGSWNVCRADGGVSLQVMQKNGYVKIPYGIDGNVKFKGSNVYLGDGSNEERNLIFSNAITSTTGNNHKVKIYGGNSSSATALGVYDMRRSRAVIVYSNSGLPTDGSDTLNISSKITFTATGSVSSSDRRLKQDFETLDKYEGFFNSLEPQSYLYKDGNSGRRWVGFVAQDVEQALLNNGLTTQDFSGLVIQPIDESHEEYKGFNDFYTLRYEEFISLNTYMIQKTRKELEEAKDKIEDLQRQIKIIIERMNENA